MADEMREVGTGASAGAGASANTDPVRQVVVAPVAGFRRRTLVHSSGQAAWDDAVRLADRKWDRVMGEILPGAQGHVAAELSLPDPVSVVFAGNTHDLIVRLRKVVSDMNTVEAMELLRSRVAKTKSNAEFLMTMALS